MLNLLRLKSQKLIISKPIGFLAHNRTFIRRAHFDTRKFAHELEKEGVSPTQAVAILNALENVLNSTVEKLSAEQVTRSEFAERVYAQKVDFAKLKSDLQNVDLTEFNRINDEQERLKTDVEKTRQHFKESIAKARANIRLDLNLEKGRVKEESAGHELRIQELNARIDQELSNFKTHIEGTKIQVLQWLIGVCTGTFALMLAYIRLIS
ncbi:Fmp32 protein [Starmerella bacillaris]|uniref:Fmp32 protein n=1 Tax=Starmerella bacillaris TaxID=1247836 RepID=A0AAV5RCU4_STABA|nr:Fmp32 protein [Starmerella bacillaris]